MVTINLLPPDDKHIIRTEHMFWRWQRALIWTMLGSLVITGGLIAGQWMLNRSSAAVRQRVTDLQQRQAKDSSSDITGLTSKLNATIKTIQTGLGTPRSWATDIAGLVAVLPADVTLTKLDITGTGHVTFEGTAATRQSFLTLDEVLKKTTLLKNVSTTSQPARRTDVPFTYTATLAQQP